MTTRTRAAAAALATAIALAPCASLAVSCSGSATSVAFGSYNVFSASNDDSTGTITVTCSKSPGDPSGTVSVNYEIELGSGGSGNVLARQMASGGNTLNYNLFTNNARTSIWGNGVTGNSVSNSFNLTNGTPSRSRTHTVYGRIPPLQDASVGNYGDNILVSINY